MRRHLMKIAGTALVMAVLTGCETAGGIGDSVSGLFTRESGPEKPVETSAPPPSDGGAPFSTAADVAYAALVWDAMHNDYFVGVDAIVTYPYEGTQPHGEFLEIITTNASIDGHVGMLIIKKNYVGDEITSEDVANDPDAYIDSVTIMFEREAGYDSDNMDWFWAKYGPEGTVMTNPMGKSLAGRVAKGADQGCIACHVAAPGGDFVFSHDRLAMPVATN